MTLTSKQWKSFAHRQSNSFPDIINSSIDAAYNHLRTIVDGSPGAGLSAVLHQLWSQSQTLTNKLLPRFRPAYSSGQSDSAFRLLEYFEACIVEDTMQALMARHTTQSLVWLHDGFLIAQPPTENVLRRIEKAVLSRYQLHPEQTCFNMTLLENQHEEYVEDLRNTASATALALARQGPGGCHNVPPASNTQQRAWPKPTVPR